MGGGVGKASNQHPGSVAKYLPEHEQGNKSTSSSSRAPPPAANPNEAAESAQPLATAQGLLDLSRSAPPPPVARPECISGSRPNSGSRHSREVARAKTWSRDEVERLKVSQLCRWLEALGKDISPAIARDKALSCLFKEISKAKPAALSGIQAIEQLESWPLQEVLRWLEYFNGADKDVVDHKMLVELVLAHGEDLPPPPFLGESAEDAFITQVQNHVAMVKNAALALLTELSKQISALEAQSQADGKTQSQEWHPNAKVLKEFKSKELDSSWQEACGGSDAMSEHPFLDVSTGERLDATFHEASGWAWCIRGHEQGWVPITSLIEVAMVVEHFHAENEGEQILNLQKAQEVEVKVRHYSGWSLCILHQESGPHEGLEGWVPDACLGDHPRNMATKQHRLILNGLYRLAEEAYGVETSFYKLRTQGASDGDASLESLYSQVLALVEEYKSICGVVQGHAGNAQDGQNAMCSKPQSTAGSPQSLMPPGLPASTATPRPFSHPELPPWVMPGASCRWNSTGQKQTHPVTIKKICVQRRQVLVTFDADATARKIVLFDEFKDLSKCPLLPPRAKKHRRRHHRRRPKGAAGEAVKAAQDELARDVRGMMNDLGVSDGATAQAMQESGDSLSDSDGSSYTSSSTTSAPSGSESPASASSARFGRDQSRDDSLKTNSPEIGSNYVMEGDAAKQESAQREAVQNKSTEQEAAEHETAECEAAEREDAGREAAEREAAEHEAAARKAAAREAAEHEAAKREAVEREAAEREAAEREAAEREAAAREAAERESAEREAAEREAAEREAAEREAAEREEAERQAAQQDHAVLKLQCFWRRILALRSAVKKFARLLIQQTSAVAVEARQRKDEAAAEVQKLRLAAEEAAAVVLQAGERGRRAREDARSRRTRQSVVQLQRVARRYRALELLQAVLRAEAEENAAQHVQRIWRGFKGRCKSKHRKEELEARAAAILRGQAWAMTQIQAYCRRYLGRIAVAKEQFRWMAAARIQAHSRGRITRQRYHPELLCFRQTREDAAAFVQASMLMLLVRSEYLAMHKQRSSSAIQVQSYVRKYMAIVQQQQMQREAVESRSAAKIQSWCRGHRARERAKPILQKRQKAARQLQGLAHIRCAKQEACTRRAEKASVTIQTLLRCMAACSIVHCLRQHKAAIRIQGLFHMVAARKLLKLHRTTQRVVRIQAAWRGHVAKRTTLRRRADMAGAFLDALCRGDAQVGEARDLVWFNKVLAALEWKERIEEKDQEKQLATRRLFEASKLAARSTTRGCDDGNVHRHLASHLASIAAMDRGLAASAAARARARMRARAVLVSQVSEEHGLSCDAGTTRAQAVDEGLLARLSVSDASTEVASVISTSWAIAAANGSRTPNGVPAPHNLLNTSLGAYVRRLSAELNVLVDVKKGGTEENDAAGTLFLNEQMSAVQTAEKSAHALVEEKLSCLQRELTEVQEKGRVALENAQLSIQQLTSQTQALREKLRVEAEETENGLRGERERKHAQSRSLHEIALSTQIEKERLESALTSRKPKPKTYSRVLSTVKSLQQQLRDLEVTGASNRKTQGILAHALRALEVRATKAIGEHKCSDDRYEVDEHDDFKPSEQVRKKQARQAEQEQLFRDALETELSNLRKGLAARSDWEVAKLGATLREAAEKCGDNAASACSQMKSWSEAAAIARPWLGVIVTLARANASVSAAAGHIRASASSEPSIASALHVVIPQLESMRKEVAKTKPSETPHDHDMEKTITKLHTVGNGIRKLRKDYPDPDPEPPPDVRAQLAVSSEEPAPVNDGGAPAQADASPCKEKRKPPAVRPEPDPPCSPVAARSAPQHASATSQSRSQQKSSMPMPPPAPPGVPPPLVGSPPTQSPRPPSQPASLPKANVPKPQTSQRDSQPAPSEGEKGSPQPHHSVLRDAHRETKAQPEESQASTSSGRRGNAALAQASAGLAELGSELTALQQTLAKTSQRPAPGKVQQQRPSSAAGVRRGGRPPADALQGSSASQSAAAAPKAGAIRSDKVGAPLRQGTKTSGSNSTLQTGQPLGSAAVQGSAVRAAAARRRGMQQAWD